jgi:iron complex transport system substrate-binding protein
VNRRGFLAVASCAMAAPGLALAQKTPRVITVGGALTEIVYRLDGQRLLVATDTTSTFPEAALALPKVGYQRSLSAEGLLALSPTLLLAGADAGPPATLQQLSSAGVAIVRTKGDHTFDSLVANVGQVAASLSLSRQGKALADQLRSEWNATRGAIREEGARPRVMFVLSHAANNVQVAGGGTAAEAMIAYAGGVNALSGFDGYRPLSPEAAIAAAPDFILCTREGVSALGGVDALLSRPGIALTPAARARRVLAPDALLLLGFGPRLPQAVHDLAQGFGTLKAA